MQLNTLKRVHKNKISRQVGRGSKRGKTSGRGTKGQNSRSGHKKRPELRDIIKTLPKLRGRGKNSFKGFQVALVPINVGTLESVYSAGGEVNPKTLLENGLIQMTKGRLPKVKILGHGEISKKVTITGCVISVDAKAKIEKAGGMVK